MNDKMLFVCGLLVSATVVSAAELAAPLAFEMPQLMKTYAGEEVKTLADWETVRRPEIRERILTRMYGKRGLVGTAFPKPDTPLQEGFVSYHLRTGEHELTPCD